MPPFFEDASSNEDFGSNGMNLELVQIVANLNAKIIDLEDKLAKAEARAKKAEEKADEAEARAKKAEAMVAEL